MEHTVTDLELQRLLEITIQKEASDLHLVPGHFPAIRVNNTMLFLRDFGVLSGPQVVSMPTMLLTPVQLTLFKENREIDFGYQLREYRFRVNLYTSRGLPAASFRLIPSVIKTIPELGLPDKLSAFADYRQGLILFTGPTGEGKSTSLAAIINEINMRHSRHIITIEDPIEFVYPSGKSIISQRELYKDTLSWNIALKSALREDPDIVLVGEMRDYDTIQSAITIAETGHLVFSTLHTGSTTEAISRIVDVFPAHQQNQIRSSLSESLIAIVAQRLLPDAEGLGRVPAVEILLNDHSVSSVIRDGKNFMLDTILETSEEKGMILFEKYLSKLYAAGRITKAIAQSYAIRKQLAKRYLI